jgi:NAD(P)-dependent dehydrogenase (short-subunit alcohol dehydrogenase family)
MCRRPVRCARCSSDLGRIDVLVNNAGGSFSGAPWHRWRAFKPAALR